MIFDYFWKILRRLKISLRTESINIFRYLDALGTSTNGAGVGRGRGAGRGEVVREEPVERHPERPPDVAPAGARQVVVDGTRLTELWVRGVLDGHSIWCPHCLTAKNLNWMPAASEDAPHSLLEASKRLLCWLRDCPFTTWEDHKKIGGRLLRDYKDHLP